MRVRMRRGSRGGRCVKYELGECECPDVCARARGPPKGQMGLPHSRAHVVGSRLGGFTNTKAEVTKTTNSYVLCIIIVMVELLFQGRAWLARAVVWLEPGEGRHAIISEEQVPIPAPR